MGILGLCMFYKQIAIWPIGGTLIKRLCAKHLAHTQKPHLQCCIGLYAVIVGTKPLVYLIYLPLSALEASDKILQE